MYLSVTTQLEKPRIYEQWDFLPAGKALGKHSYHSAPPSTKVKKDWCIIATPMSSSFRQGQLLF